MATFSDLRQRILDGDYPTPEEMREIVDHLRQGRYSANQARKSQGSGGQKGQKKSSAKVEEVPLENLLE